jgi:hypothetical protein
MSKTPTRRRQPSAAFPHEQDPVKAPVATTPAAPEPPAAPQRPQPFKVRAKILGFYGNKRRREGDIFPIAGEKDFSKRWMERVAPETPEVSQNSLEFARKRDEELKKGDGASLKPNAADVLDDDEGGDPSNDDPKI